MEIKYVIILLFVIYVQHVVYTCSLMFLFIEISCSDDVAALPQGIIKYLQYLKVKYSKLSIIPDSINQQWPPTLGQTYHNLELRELQRDLPNKDMVTNYLKKLLYGKASQKSSLSKRITLKEIFPVGKIQHTETAEAKILFTGVPGIGKSTIARKICHDWGQDLLASSFYLVLLFCLRDKCVNRAQGLFDLVKYQYPHHAEEVTQYLIDTLGKGVLVIFDGWDELPNEMQANSIFLDFIQNRTLPCSSVVVFSRTYAAGSLKALPSIVTHIDIVGFTPDQVKECVKLNVTVTADAEKLLHQMQVKRRVTSTCYVPLNLAILLYVTKLQDFVLPKTYTELYQIFIHNALLRHLKSQPSHQHIKALHEINHLPEEIKSYFCQLCSFALDGLVEEKIVFHQKDVDEYFPTLKLTPGYVQDTPFLGLLTSMQSYSKFGEEEQYQFVHVNLQEYLAAWKLSFLHSVDDQLQFLEKYRDNLRLERTLVFMSGLTHLNHRRFYLPLCAPVMFADLTKRIKLAGGRRSSSYMIFVIEMLFESQNMEQIKLVANNIQHNKLHFQFDLSKDHHSLVMISDFLTSSGKTWEAVQFDNPNPIMSDFLVDIFDNESPLPPASGKVEEICLQNFMKLDDVILLLHLLPFRDTVKLSLIYFHNENMCESLQLILKQRQWNFVHLSLWDLLDCSDIKPIFESVASNESIQSFYLETFREVSLPPLDQACQDSLFGLITRHSALRALRLNRCGIEGAAVDTIASALGSAPQLKELDLSHNYLGRHGHATLFQRVATNPSLKSLVLINTTNEKEIGNETVLLKKLYTALVQMLILNNKLELLDISNCHHFDNNFGKWMAMGLDVNKSLQQLLVNDTNLSTDNILNIFLSLKKNKCLTSLSICQKRAPHWIYSEASKTVVYGILSKLSNFTQSMMNFVQCFSNMEKWQNHKVDEIKEKIFNSLSSLMTVVPQVHTLVNEWAKIVVSYSENIRTILLYKAICNVLEENKRIRELDVRCSLYHVKPVARVLYKNNTLTTLSVGGSFLTDVDDLFTALLHNTSIHTLLLDNVEINDKSMQTLLEVLTSNATLSLLKIHGSSVTQDNIKKLVLNLSSKTALTELSIPEEHTKCIIPDLLRINEGRQSIGLWPIRLHCEPCIVKTHSHVSVDYFALKALAAAKQGATEFKWSAKHYKEMGN